MPNKKLLSFGLAGLLQAGALSAAEPVNVLEPVSAEPKETETLSFSSSALGLAGPIELTTSYNEDYGVIVGAMFSTYINARNALAFELEGGQNLYRINGTWGFSINETNRIKLSIERLADKDDYDFASGTESEWISQNALGASYQYIFNAGWLQAIDLNAYGAKANSKDYDDVLFYDNAGNPLVNKRRIAGGESLGGAVNFTLIPTKRLRADIGLHYDAVNYDMKYDDDDPSTSGFGFSTHLEHIVSERLKANIGTDVLSTDHTYSAGFTWLVPTEMGSDLEFSVLGSYLDSQTTDDQNYQLGVQVSYGWDDTPTEQNAGYAGFTAVGIQDLKTWTRDPAVRMPEVMAVVDEAVFDAIPELTSAIPDITRPEVSPIDFTVAPYFSNADGSALTFTATGLPDTITMNSNGRLIGDTPDLLITRDYTIDVTATNRWGFSQQDSFVLTVYVDVLPPEALVIPNASYEESSAGQADISPYFVDPNLPTSKRKTTNADQQSELGFTYTLTKKPANWTTPLVLNPNTGVISGVVPAYQTQGGNNYNFEVTATNYAGSVTSSFVVSVVNNVSNVFSEQIPSQTVVEGQNVAGLLNLNDYFSDQNNGTLTYSTSTGLEGSGLRITTDGRLVGVAAEVDADTTYRTSVTAENAEGETATRELEVTIDATPGNIVLDEAIPDQTVVANTELNITNSINLNNYFSNDEGGAIAFESDDLTNIGAVVIDETGLITGTVNNVSVNTAIPVTVEAYNPDNETAEPVATQINYTLIAIPTSSPISDQSADENSAYSLDVNNTATGNFQPETPGDLVYTLNEAPTGWTIDNQGVISGTVPVYDMNTPSNNNYTVTVSAVNSLDATLTTTQSFTLTVLDVLGQISVNTPPVQNAPEGTTYSAGSNAIDLNQVFTSSDGQALTFSDNGQLANIGLAIDANGYITGTLNVDANVIDLVIPVTAVETNNPSVTATANVTYNIAALVSSEALSDQTVLENDISYTYDAAVEGNFQPFNPTSPQTDQNLTFSMNGAPTGLQIDAVTGVISGGTSYVQGGNNVYTITVTGTNVLDSSLSSSQSFDFTVESGAISVNAVAAQKAPEGTTYAAGSNAIDLNQVFTDSANEPLVFSDDGQLADLGLSISADGYITGTLNVDDNVVDLPITITAEQEDNSDVSAAVNIVYTVAAEVSSTALTDQVVSPNENTYTYYVGRAGNFEPFDPNNASSNRQILFSMTGAPAGLTLDPISGVIFGGVAYNEGGTNQYDITVTAVNVLNPIVNANLSSSESFQFTVEQSDISVTPPPAQRAPEGTTYTAGSNAIDLNQVFTDSANQSLVFSDDGQLADLGLSISADGYITGTLNVDANVVDLPITITAVEENNSAVSASVDITYTVAAEVSSTALTDQVVSADDAAYTYYVGRAGNFEPFDPNDASNNRQILFSMTGAPVGLTIDPVSGVIYGGVAYNNGGSNQYDITVTAVNVLNPVVNANLNSSESFQFTVLETISATNAAFSFDANQVVEESLVSYVNNPENATLTFTVDGSAESQLSAMNLQLDSDGRLWSSAAKSVNDVTPASASVTVLVTADDNSTTNMQLTVDVDAPGVIEGPRMLEITVPVNYNNSALYNLDLNQYYENSLHSDSTLTYNVTDTSLRGIPIFAISSDGTLMGRTELLPWPYVSESIIGYEITDEYGAARDSLSVYYVISSDATQVEIKEVG